jgi:hypothetical protein
VQLPCGTVRQECVAVVQRKARLGRCSQRCNRWRQRGSGAKAAGEGEEAWVIQTVVRSAAIWSSRSPMLYGGSDCCPRASLLMEVGE